MSMPNICKITRHVFITVIKRAKFNYKENLHGNGLLTWK